MESGGTVVISQDRTPESVGGVQRICCIGADDVGRPAMAGIAERCQGALVCVASVNVERRATWNDQETGKLPTSEPVLDAVLNRPRALNLHWGSEVELATTKANMVSVSENAPNAPTKTRGLGAGHGNDPRPAEVSARTAGQGARCHTIAVVKSNQPVRSTEAVRAIRAAAPGMCMLAMLPNPELLSEERTIAGLEASDRLLIGGGCSSEIATPTEAYRQSVAANGILSTNRLASNRWSSKMSKLAVNAVHAQSISSVNDTDGLCDCTCDDGWGENESSKLENPFRPLLLQATPWFGDGFHKDILDPPGLFRQYGREEVAGCWHQRGIARLMAKKLADTITVEEKALQAFSIDADNRDAGKLLVIRHCRDQGKEGVGLQILDPKVTQR